MGQLRFDELSLELDTRKLESAPNGGTERLGTIDGELFRRGRSDVFIDETPFICFFLAVVRV